MTLSKVFALLNKFCDDIDAVTLERNEDGYAAPMATGGWSDIAKTYLEACELLGREPKWNEGEDRVGLGTWEPPASWPFPDDELPSDHEWNETN